MGITGLLPLLKSIHRPCNLKKFAGQTIGVDAYGWLHRGTVACAIDLALGRPTRKYIDFSMHRVRMLIHFGVIPYIVFDGDYLPSKAVTEADRAKRRDESKRKGLELYRLNKPSQAHLELQKAVDVTPQMAREFIEELKKIGVQYVVAPYEADAQLVYLERKGIIQGMLSEDSDLLVFGAKILLTKLDQYGDCIEINRAEFTACREVSLVGWSDAEFRRMAILSGCDYLANINRMGLKSAYRHVRKYKTIEKILRMLQFDGQHHVPAGYLEAFQKAELTFLHQRVFCPLANNVVMMTDLGDQAEPEDFSFIGPEIKQSVAIGVAKGDLDPMTKAPIFIANNVDTTPRTPWGNPRKSTVEIFPDTKSNKSIDSFFKSKRTPLGELDPNSFTPSPTQERLLQHASEASWDSNPVPIETQTLQTSTLRPSPAPCSALSSLGNGRGLNAPLSGPSAAKKRRLCLDLSGSEESQESRRLLERRSPFFTANITQATPSVKGGKGGRKAKADDVNIWSDDSLEDAMAELPDLSDHAFPIQKGKMTIFKEEEKENKKAKPNIELRELSVQEDSQTSVSSGGTAQSEDSTLTAATNFTSSAPSVAETFDKNVKTEIAELKHNFQYHLASEDQSRRGDQVAGNERSTLSDFASPLAPLLRQKSMTPLQRLGMGALSRSKSCSGLNGCATHISTTIKGVTPKVSNNAMKQHIPALSNLNTFGPDASTTKGSEDAISPDSEESADEALSISEADPGMKPEINLGRFAFSE